MGKGNIMPIIIKAVTKKDDAYYIEVHIKSLCCFKQTLLEYKEGKELLDILNLTTYKISSDLGKLVMKAIAAYDIKSTGT